MDKAYRNCQSCGMPLKRDAARGGTEADGSRSVRFCSHCYRNGTFTLPEITVEGMRLRVKEKLRESGMPGFLAALFARNISKLERWRGV